MRELIAIAFIAGLIMAPGVLAAELSAAPENINLPIKQLYSAPSEDSNLVYSIPIEVKVLQVADNGNWYKVKISYNLGPFSYTFIGWTHIPVGDVLTASAAASPKGK